MRDPKTWRHQAACRGLDPEVFFPDEDGPERPLGAGGTGPERPLGAGGTGPERPLGAGGTEPGDAAKAVCVRCPVRQPCLEWALATREKEGVWGGCDERDRRRLLRQTRQSA